MRIALFGATGMTGREVLDLALHEGHQVSALVRDPTALPPTDNLRVVVGDATDPVAVAKCLAGADAVLSCLGVGGKGDGRPSTFVSTATRIIAEQMRQQGIDRLVVMSNIGASGSGSWLARRAVYPLLLRKWKVSRHKNIPSPDRFRQEGTGLPMPLWVWAPASPSAYDWIGQVTARRDPSQKRIYFSSLVAN